MKKLSKNYKNINEITLINALSVSFNFLEDEPETYYVKDLQKQVQMVTKDTGT